MLIFNTISLINNLYIKSQDMDIINAGQIVERVVRRNKVSISELARRMRVNRRSVYNWFDQKTLKIDIICRIGHVLNYDFSADFPEAFGERGISMEKVADEFNDDGHKHPNSVHYWMVKYIALLEKYNSLLSQDASRNENTDHGEMKKMQSKPSYQPIFETDTLTSS